MKLDIRSFTSIPRCAFAVALTLTPAAINAAVIQTNLNDADQLKYTNDASNSDLLNDLTGTVLSGWRIENGANPSKINDGVHGGTGVPVGGAWTNGPATVTYNLGTGNGFGYDLTSIQSIASWGTDGYGNQAFNVEIQLVGSTIFTALASVNNSPFVAGNITNQGSTKTTLTDSTGILASGVQLIRFTTTAAGGSSAGDSVIREIDVNGIATVPEPTSFALLSLGALALLRRRRNH
jgi:PEP-CTERM motif